MRLSEKEISEIVEAVRRLTPAQQQWVKSAIHAFGAACTFWRAPDSDVITEAVLATIGDRLLTHHAGSREALSKDRFEFAFEQALNASGIPAALVSSRTNPGHDITIAGVPVSLKTEAAKSIKADQLHISKWMELGKGPWELPYQRDAFLHHMRSYERIFSFRKLKTTLPTVNYELVEIPRALLLESAQCVFEVCEDSEQYLKPGYGYVRDAASNLKFELYFDAGSERKLRIQKLRKDLCKVHATWTFDSAPA